MILNGDIPVGLMEKLYDRLTDNGIYIENFKVDAVNGIIEVDTSVPISEKDINDIISSNLWDEAKYYVNDLVDNNALDSAFSHLQNERGFLVLGNAAVVATLGAGGAVIPALSPGATACIVVAGIVAVICLVKTMLDNA